MSLLAPLDSGSWLTYWKAPLNTKSGEFILVLGALPDVSGVILVVSLCGYSKADASTVCGLLSILFFSPFDGPRER